MSNSTWFTSDHHFYHGNILTFSDEHGAPVRTFDSTHAMNEHMIEQWNAHVKDGDIVYHVGDFAMKYRNPKDVANIARRLNGNLDTILLGNHDEAEHLIGVFRKIRLRRVFRDHKFVATHFPIRGDQFESKGTHLVHGHTHRRMVHTSKKGELDARYINVCVENWDYRPVHLDEILARMK